MNEPAAFAEVGSEFVIVVGGIVTSAATAIAVFLIGLYTGTDVSSWTVWFVIPVGSGLCGFVAAAGYYLASRLTQRPPSHQTLFNMVGVGLSTYALIQYLNFHALTLPNGIHVSDIVSFWDYYQAEIESTSLTTLRGAASTGELGSLGYLYESIRVIGFLAGGLAMYFYMAEQPYCRECRRYYAKRSLLSTRDVAEVDRFLATCGVSFPNVAEKYAAVMRRKHADSFGVTLYSCGQCDRKEFRFVLGSGRDKIDIARYPYRGDFPPPPGSPVCASAAEATGGPLAMQGVLDYLLGEPKELRDFEAKIARLTREKLAPSAIADLRKDLLEVEERAAQSEQPIRALREEVMRLLDMSLVSEAVMDLEPEVRAAFAAKYGETFTDTECLWSYLVGHFSIMALRLYARRYDDVAPNDWLSLYGRVSKELAQQIVRIMVEETTAVPGDKVRAATFLLSDETLKATRELCLSMPPKTAAPGTSPTQV